MLPSPQRTRETADPTNVHLPWASWSNRSRDLFAESVFRADVSCGSRTRDIQINGLVLYPELTVVDDLRSDPMHGTDGAKPSPVTRLPLVG